MSEESKIDSDYVHMGDRAVRPGTAGLVKAPLGLDDPSLSQEDKDLRLAIALQQQENASALAHTKKKSEEARRADQNRTGRSNVGTRLAAVRDKDHGMLTVPAAYASDDAYVRSDGDYLPPAGKQEINMASMKGALPQEVADHNLAVELQKVEQSSVGTAQAAQSLLIKEKAIAEAQEHRTARSGRQAFHKIKK